MSSEIQLINYFPVKVFDPGLNVLEKQKHLQLSAFPNAAFSSVLGIAMAVFPCIPRPFLYKFRTFLTKGNSER